MELSLKLPLEAESAATARHSLDGLVQQLDEELVDDLRLLVTELVTNSIRHARPTSESWVRIDLHVKPRVVRVEVIDKGPGFAPDVSEPRSTDTSGRGLLLVQKIADRWGVGLDGRTRVWFEIDRQVGC